jgi:hypothetical protein
VKTEKDYEEFLTLLNKHKVRYCIIGAFALAFHARPRYTKDIDILVEASADNAKKILKVLNEFGFGSLNLAIEDLAVEGNILQLGYEPVRIDIMTSIKGLDFTKVWREHVTPKSYLIVFRIKLIWNCYYPILNPGQNLLHSSLMHHCSFL